MLRFCEIIKFVILSRRRRISKEIFLDSAKSQNLAQKIRAKHQKQSFCFFLLLQKEESSLLPKTLIYQITQFRRI